MYLEYLKCFTESPDWKYFHDLKPNILHKTRICSYLNTLLHIVLTCEQRTKIAYIKKGLQKNVMYVFIWL